MLDSAEELDDLLSYVGDDYCVLVFSSAIDDSRNQWIVSQFADLAVEVRKNTKRMNFVAYDVTRLGYSKSLTDNSHPQVHLSSGKRNDEMKIYRGSLVLEEVAEWLKKHADNKFKMKTAQLD